MRRRVSSETRRKMSESHRGKPLSEQHKKRISEGANKRAVDNYQSIHSWVQRNKTRVNVCVDCGNKGKTDWSNIDHSYRRNLNDYVERCKSCHKRYDLKLNKSKID